MRGVETSHFTACALIIITPSGTIGPSQFTARALIIITPSGTIGPSLFKIE